MWQYRDSYKNRFKLSYSSKCGNDACNLLALLKSPCKRFFKFPIEGLRKSIKQCSYFIMSLWFGHWKALNYAKVIDSPYLIIKRAAYNSFASTNKFHSKALYCKKVTKSEHGKFLGLLIVPHHIVVCGQCSMQPKLQRSIG